MSWMMAGGEGPWIAGAKIVKGLKVVWELCTVAVLGVSKSVGEVCVESVDSYR